MTQSSQKKQMANISLTLFKNRLFGSGLKSPTQIGSLSVKISVTNISRLGTFKYSLELIILLCPFALHYLRYAVTSFFTISRISLADSKRAGQKVHRKIAAEVQNVKPLYFLSRSFDIREKYCQQSFFLSLVIKLTITKETRRRVSRGRD
jgi:hypothetical protein